METLIFTTHLHHFNDAPEIRDLRMGTPPAFSGCKHEKDATPLAFFEIDVKNRQPLSLTDFFNHARCTPNAIFHVADSNYRS